MAAILCPMGPVLRGIRKRGEDASYKAYFTYLNYDHRIQSMIYTTNWIERLQKDFRRVTRMRGDAQRGVCHPAYGKDCHGQEVLPETGSKN